MSAPAVPGGAATPATKDVSDQVILDYLNRRGFTRAASALTAELGTDGASATGGGKAIALGDLAERNAPSANRPAGLAGVPAPPGPGVKRRPDQAVAGGQLLADPPSWEKGYEGLRTFVENSLDIHRPELHPLLLPLFVHSYLDLVLVGYREAADQFLERFSVDHAASDPHIVRMLAAIRLPSHVGESEEATRWRQERYSVRLSERGWGLLLGWLQGGGLAGSIEGTEARGRDRVLAIINERVKVDAVPGPPAKSATDFGLLSDFNGKRPPKGLDDLKLGPAPVDPKLQREIQRATRDANVVPRPILPDASTDVALLEIPVEEGGLPPLVSPFPAEIPPYPVTLRTIDVVREVEKVREARKRIKLGAEAFQLGGGQGLGKEKVGEAAKPSVCLFTVHDAGDSLTTTTFSEDSTLMAAGFSESYIRLWNLTGGKLPGLRNDFDSDEVTDAAGLKRIRQKVAPTSRKLVGHSGPIYALSFDPVPGPSAPPRYLLSASQDTTVRLWSLETYTNLVAYRGHREPVWDVQWGPKGIYFATASRDRTARLWSTDKVSALRIFAGHLSDVNCVRFHPNSLYLATGSSDRTCRLWDVQKGTCVRVFVGHRGAVSTIAMSPDGRYLASAADDLTINLWDLGSGRKIKSMTGHTSSIHSLSFSAESTVLVSGSSDATVRVWDVLAVPVVETGRKAFEGKLSGPRRVSTAGILDVGEGKKMGAKGVFVEDASESGDLLATLATKRTPVFEVRFTPRNLCLAAGPMQDPGS